MKKRLFFLLVLAALCVTLFSAAAYADPPQSLFRLQLVSETPRFSNEIMYEKPYETWYFLDGTHIYVSNGNRYTYTLKNNVITVDDSRFDNGIIRLDTAANKAVATASNTQYNFAYQTGAMDFTSKFTKAEQQGNLLVFECSQDGGSGNYSYSCHVYNKNGVELPVYSRSGNVLKFLVTKGGDYDAFLTVKDGRDDASEYSTHTIKANCDSDFVVVEGTVTQYLGKDTDVIVPGTINEMDVTGIGPNVFANKSAVKSINIQAPVTEIGAGAFTGCTALTTLKLPDALTEIGANAFSGCSSLGELAIPENVTKIGAGAFTGCPATVFCDPKSVTATALTAVNVPFYDNNDTDAEFALHTIKDENNKDVVVLYAYTGNKTEVTVPDTLPVDRIGDGAFANNTALTSVTVKANVAEIGAGAFSGCTSLETLVLPDNVAAIGANAIPTATKIYCDPLTNPDHDPNESGVTAKTLSNLRRVFYANTGEELEPPVFGLLYITVNGETKLALYAYTGTATVIGQAPSESDPESAEFPDCVEYIYDRAFKDNKSITKVVVPGKVTGIGANAFYGCTRLTEVETEDEDGTLGVTKIGANAFYGCTQLKKITLGDNVAEIGTNAFYDCPENMKIFCGTSTSTADAVSALPHVFYDKRDTTADFALIKDGDNTILTAYTGANNEPELKDGITHIAGGAFDAMKANLKSVTIPYSVKTIPTNLFNGFEVLETIRLEEKRETKEGVETLEDRAITNCPVLQTVTIPDSLKSFGAGEFSNCPSLKTLDMPDEYTAIDAGAFTSCTAKLYCKVGSNTAKKLSALNRPFYAKEDESADPKIARDSAGEFGLLYTTINGKQTLALYIYTGARTTIAENVIPAHVKYIYNSAFRGNKKLTSINVPSTVTGIGANAFYDCAKLTKIILPDTGLQTIDPNAFNGCDADVFCTYSSDTAKKLSAIGHPFYHLSDFQTDPPRFALLYREDGRTLALHEYTGTETGAAAGIDVPPYVQAIDDGAFDAVKATLTKVGISAVEIIPTGLFDGFTSLTEITFGTGVRTVQPGAIQNCPELESVRGLQRDNAISTIRTNFADCPKLVRELASSSMRLTPDYTTIPYAEKAKIKDSPIAESLNLNIATCENGVVTAQKTGTTTVLAYFSGEGNYSSIRVEVVSGLKGLTLPDALTELEDEAFAGNSAIQYAVLPNGVTDIGKRAFADDANLKLINIPKDAALGESVFTGCSAAVAVIDEGDSAAENYCINAKIPFQYAAN